MKQKFKRGKLIPKNGFSKQFRLSPEVQSSALLLAAAAKALDGVFVMEIAEPPNGSAYAIAIAVHGDTEKIAQLIALAKEWTVVKGDRPATSSPHTPAGEPLH